MNRVGTDMLLCECERPHCSAPMLPQHSVKKLGCVSAVQLSKVPLYTVSVDERDTFHAKPDWSEEI